MNLVRKAATVVNSGQIPVIACYQPLFKTAKQIQWMWPEEYGEGSFVIIITRRCGSVYLGVVVVLVRYFEFWLLQVKNCNDISPEKISVLVYFFGHPYSLYSMFQCTTKIESVHGNV